MTDISKQIRKLEFLCRKTMGADRFSLNREIQKLKQKAKKYRPEKSASGEADAAAPDPFPEKLGQLEKRIDFFIKKKSWRKTNRPRPKYNDDLPIVAKKAEIIDAIRNHPVVVISGETGSGKTTQIPKFCLEAGRGIDGVIGCTQPRRIAAMTVSARIAEELGEEPGKSVGYKIRFKDQTGENAFIKIMTDGILLAEAQGDRWLREYDTIIVDEAHERSLNIDFVLGILKTLVQKRRDLKLIITSATIDTEKFSKAFDNAPIIQVSGRMFPVDVRYMAPDAHADDDDQTHVDLAVKAVDRLQQESPYGGDILVFMPTEQDIRETCELIESRNYTGVTIMPLFARLSAGEQSRVFGQVRGRKIIVSTNVAETSITIPGIKYVVDTGLARISQYSPRTRTTGLPVMPVSRSSADQRMGRCGRVANGICIRLYTEADYENRPRFTPPEILRSNLAEVILRMMSLKLGEVKDFPFIDRPADKNIQDGLNLLEELGAVLRTGNRMELTERGLMMARIPLDPRLSRMLLEAGERGCLEEMTVIAAALSIQDPRERPLDKRAQADQAHARFRDTRSDFMSLLNIWKLYHTDRKDQKTARSAGAFCRTNYLSYRRMREWRDIHQQICAILEEQDIRNRTTLERLETGKPGEFSPLYTAVHQAILGGFLANIAYKTDKNFYKASRDRLVMLFPGSALFNGGSKWIVAAEMVETSRVFARMAAGIDVEWLEAIGGDQCRRTYMEAHWEKDRGEVVAWEQVSLYGLVIIPKRPASYGPVNPAEASKIFIRSALVEGDVKQPFSFMAYNRKLIDGIREQEDKVRRRGLLVDDETLCAFYESRLPEGIYDIRTLKHFLKTRRSDRFLCMKEEDLYIAEPDQDELAQFPDGISLGNTALPCDYVFDPGKHDDGVTLRVPAALAPSLRPEILDWVVPGLFREKISAMIKSLPKEFRKQLVPVNQTVDVIAENMVRDESLPLITALSGFIYRRFGVDIPASAWVLDELPDHLKMRISIRGPGGEELCSGRDASLLRQSVSTSVDPDHFSDARKDWEVSGVREWNFPDLPPAVTLHGKDGVKWVAYPGLRASENDLALHLFEDRAEAVKSHKNGIIRLFSLCFAREFRSLKAHLVFSRDMETPARYFGGIKKLEKQLYDSVVEELFCRNIRSRDVFERHGKVFGPALVEEGVTKLKAVVCIIRAYHECRTALFDMENANSKNPGMIRFLSGLRDELANLVPETFVALYDADRMAHLPRYIRTIEMRAQRGLVNLEKDQAKARDVKVHGDRLTGLLKELSPDVTPEKRSAVEEFFWLIEEYKVSLFAQELKTPVKVSPKRLDQAWSEIRRMV